ncbi:Ribose ABC transporter, permease protein [Desulfurococcus amylolyticus 1221n]|uniref:Ribose ABC transporter, permease protein n=1 Tax=Desulfurococcus amylolyticus (strain DSM 18924 / JCM 16383 / VKM B-2413 / 1221n) TaxID=490899 RepID=B8D4B5_DESA1|nr:ABC transporter permease [Desulfurococcus amylolyticus]ACL10946.1 Ribose ABC transporter, permease protein [Desulfurococcus amylolyticus 1221n]
MRILIVRRKTPLKYGTILIILLSLTIGVALFTTILAIQGRSPVEVLGTLLISFVSPSIVKDFIILTMLGYALLVSFKGALWNIGAEGQLFISTIPVIVLTLHVMPNPPSQLHAVTIILLIIIVSTITGAAWASIAGFIRAYLEIDEVPVTLILNYIAYYVVNILVIGPLKGTRVYGYNRTDEIPSIYRLYVTGLERRFTGNPAVDTFLGFIYEVIYYLPWLVAMIIIMFTAWYLLNKTQIGLRIRILGSNPDYLRSVGVNTRLTLVLALTISGAIVGFTSAFYTLSDLLRLSYPIEGQTAGYGYLAILVAWLSMLDYKLIPVSAYIVASLRTAGINLQVGGLGGLEQTLLLIGLILAVYTIVRFLRDYEVRVV